MRQGRILGSIVRATQGDTRSLDSSSNEHGSSCIRFLEGPSKGILVV